MKNRRVLSLEQLECRNVLTGGANAWIAIGPSPISNPTGFPPAFPQNETFTGRVTSLAFGQYQNQTALFIGSAGGGVWRSTNFNTPNPTYTPLTDSIPLDANGLSAGSMDVGSVATYGNQVIVGTGEANFGDSRYGSGILVSNTGGDSWLPLITGGTNANDFVYQSISKVIADPTTGNLYAAVVPRNLQSSYLPAVGNNAAQGNPIYGVYQSLNGGVNWTKISGGQPAAGVLPEGAVVTDLEYTRDATGFKLYAGVGNIAGDANGLNGVYIGTPGPNNTFNWAKVNGAGLAGGRIALASDHVSTVYAAVATPMRTLNNADNTTLQGVFRLTNAGANVQSVTPAGFTDTQMFYNLAFGLSPYFYCVVYGSM